MIAVTSPPIADFVQRRERLLRQAIQDGDRRFREDLRLVYYEDHRPTHRGGHVAQESLGYAAALLTLGENVERARTLIREVLRHQNLNPADGCYGGFFWFAGQDRVIDHNAVSFVVPWLGWLVRHHAAELGQPLVAALQKSLQLSLQGLLAHASAWSYTNIFLLNIAGQFAIAEACDDPRARGIAEQEWREWLAYTNQFGIVEYLSPTYTPVQIEALELILDSAAASNVSEAVQSVLDCYWQDLLLSFHQASGRFAGTLSRGKPDDYLQGRSPLNLLAYLHLGVPGGDLGCYNATHALAVREISDRVRTADFAPLPRTLRRWLPMQGIRREVHLCQPWALATQSGHYRLETSLFATWDGGGFYHKAGDEHHQNYCRQRAGRALFVERWQGQLAAVTSRWTVFDRDRSPTPRLQQTDERRLVATFVIPGGELCLEFLVPERYRLERAEHEWSLVADIPARPSLVAVSVTLGQGSSPSGLEVEMRDDSWLVSDDAREVLVPKAVEHLYEGGGWDVPRGRFSP